MTCRTLANSLFVFTAILVLCASGAQALPTAQEPFGLTNDDAAHAPMLLTLPPSGDETAEGRFVAVGKAFIDEQGNPGTPPMAHEAFDGTKYRLYRFKSPSAQATQLHFSRFVLPENAQAFIYNLPNGQEEQQILGPLTGAGPLGTGEFWTIPLTGDQIVVELQWIGDEPTPLPFEVDALGAHARRPERTAPHQAQRPKMLGTARLNDQEVIYEDVDGLAVVGGDIIIGTVAEIEASGVVTEENLVGMSTAGAPDSDNAGALRAPKQNRFIAWLRSIFGAGPQTNRVGSATIITRSTGVWPQGVVPYAIDPALPDQARVTNAVNHWNAQMGGVVRLVPRTGESAYVNFQRASSAGTCSSSVGRTGYAQAVQVGDYCSTGNVIHEIGHAVGLWHEHTRNDRDTYVTVLTQNIDPAAAYNFNKVGTSGQGVGAYDYGSVMHYPAYGFSSNGQPTIVTIPPGIPIGQRSSLSTGDIAGVQQLYKAGVPAVPSISVSPSSVSSTGIIGTSTTLQQQFTLRNSGAAGSTLRWAANTSQPWMMVSPANGSLSAGATQTVTVTMSVSALAEGTHAGTVSIADTAASNSPQQLGVAAIMVVPRPPAISFIKPNNNSMVSGQVAIAAEAYDEQGIEAVTFYADNQFLTEDVTGPYEVVWDGLAATEGLHELRAVARDGTGVTAETAILVNLSKPVPDTTPPSNVALSGTAQRKSISLTWTPATDNVGVKEYRVFRNGTQVGSTTTTTFTQSPGSGAWQYTVSAVDVAGNVGPQSNPVTLALASQGKAK